MSLNILQIVPRLPPAVCGIGDYSWQLAEALRAHHDIHSRFLVAGTQSRVPAEDLAFPAQHMVPLTSATFRRTVAASAADAVLLHVSTYGYQTRGVPLWLARGIRSLATDGRAPPLVAMFHELYATGSPRTSAFWLQPLQKYVLRMLVRSADRVRTNRTAYSEWINAVSPRRAPEAAVQAVFSNLGELERPPPLAERPPAMVMFASGIHGGGDARAAILRAVNLSRQFGLQTLNVLGLDLADEIVGGVQVRYVHYLPADQASLLLTQCRMAYTAYAFQYLAKSGVFAAYAAHGLAVVVEEPSCVLADDLHAGRQVLTASECVTQPVPMEALQQVASQLHGWYSGHSLAATADSFARDLNSPRTTA